MAKINTQENAVQKYGIWLVSFSAILVITGGIMFYHLHEGMSWVDAIYFSTITLATVGYGDIVPQTDIGKLFTAGYVLVGVGIIAAFVNVVVRGALTRRVMRHQDDQDK